MSQKTIYSIIVAMSLSFLGLIGFQSYFLYLDILKAQNDFDKNVYQSLALIQNALEEKQAMVFVKSTNIQPNHFTSKTYVSENNSFSYSLILDDNEDFKSKGSVKHWRSINDSLMGILDSSISDSVNIEIIRLEDSLQENEDITIEFIKDKKYQINKVINKMAIDFAFQEKSLKDKVEEANLDSLIKSNLIKKGIVDSQYDYVVLDNTNSSVVKRSDSTFKEQKLKAYSTSLFETLDGNEGILSLFFPSKTTTILKSIWKNLLMSIFLCIIMFATFFYTLRAIFKQRKIAEIKSDFINNMTHEFKTPIATISIALDALLHPKHENNRNERERFGKIIQNENKRMNEQIERVLEAARIEREDIEIKHETIFIDTLIKELVGAFELEIEEANGIIHYKIDHKNTKVLADRMHLFNALRNIIENSIKYSEKEKQISIDVSRNDSHVIIAIKDNGIGMSKENIKRIFDRFYRTQKGDIHTTKGFGLGLYYSSYVIRKMHGEIKVESKLKEGSTFSIYLPIVKSDVKG